MTAPTPETLPTATCKHCGQPITFARYRDVGSPEPDYDPFDDPTVWRHRGGYGACMAGGLTFAEPGPAFDIRAIAATCLANSQRWFPSNHTSERAAVTHCTLGLAGEAGEVANKVKKLYGYMDQRNAVPDGAVADIIEELVDTLIYDLVLLVQFGADIPQAIADKVAVCEARWGGTPA